MAKCKLCKKTITNETEYCTDCIEKKDLATNESYLDDLLNSVQGNATTASDIYKKKKVVQDSDSSISLAPMKKDESFSIDMDDLSDFEQYDIMKELEEPIIISDDELYGGIIATNKENDDIANRIEDDEQEDEEDINEVETDDLLSYMEDDMNSLDVQEQMGEIDFEHNIDNEFLGMDEANVHNDSEDEYIEPALDDLLKQLDLSAENSDNNSSIDDGEENYNDYKEVEEDSVTKESPSQNKEIATEDDLLELLNQFDPSNPIEDDIQAISELLGEIGSNNIMEKEYPADVGEVFSEALEAVTELGDPDNGIKYISQEIEDNKSKKDSKVKKSKKDKKDKKEGLLSKLFSNIDDDDDLDPEKKKAKDEAEVSKELKKKKKKTKDKKGQSTNQEGAEDAPDKDSKEVVPKEDKKKEKKLKKEKKKLEILDEEVDEGRINRVGASLVFVFFGILVVFLLVSTNIFSYSLSIKNATDYFGRQRYTQAYNEVYGIELKDEDIELYDKIMTVMYVNKQLNSYNNYYHMRKFPEALDSLLKGLQRYDKYIELATMLGIKTDLDYVRNQIIAELYNVFSLSEEQAMNIINSDNQAEYSIGVYDVILENITYYN